MSPLVAYLAAFTEKAEFLSYGIFIFAYGKTAPMDWHIDMRAARIDLGNDTISDFQQLHHAAHLCDTSDGMHLDPG
jgi:hypothetical protein